MTRTGVEPCACRKPYPRCSGGMFVFVQEAAETIGSADPQMRGRGWIGDPLGEGAQRPGVRDAPMGSVAVVVAFVFTKGVHEVGLVPDERAVEQVMSAGLDPAFHDRVHSGDLDTAEYDRDACVGEDGVGEGWELAVAVAEKVLQAASGVCDVRGGGAAGLRDP